MTSTHLTEQQLNDIEQRANADGLTPGPWTLDKEGCDCGGDYPCGHGLYVTAVITSTPTWSAAERCKRTGEQPRDYDFHRSDIGDFTGADWELMAHAREDVPALLAEIHRLRAYLASLEPAAMHARSALAALCYDLDDPGSNALGALYLIQQATLGVERPKDEAAEVLARRDADVMRRCADFVRDTYQGDDIDDAAATLERDATVVERGCNSVAGLTQQLSNCPDCGKLTSRHPVPIGL